MNSKILWIVGGRWFEDIDIGTEFYCACTICLNHKAQLGMTKIADKSIASNGEIMVLKNSKSIYCLPVH